MWTLIAKRWCSFVKPSLGVWTVMPPTGLPLIPP
jgi:hypothetical protein